MPRFSIIVAAHRVQGYLRACLDSVLTQSFGDVEVVAVDDRSPDSCGAIIDEYAARDGRVVAVHQPVNSGQGLARNAGAERASGDYLLFLDGDDTLAPDTLRGLAERLEQTADPDILYFDHVRTYWWNGRRRSASRELLASAGEDVFTVLERPEFLKLFAMCSNRVYRRAFYEKHGFAFSKGIYEDALLSYTTMLSAERISCVPLVGLEYRQRRAGASTGSPGEEHFAIFDQYARLFVFLDERPHLEPLRPALFERAVSHFLFCLDNRRRVAEQDRVRYFRLAAGWYRRHLPAGFTPPADDRWRFSALAAGSFARYRSRELARRFARRARRAKRDVRRSLARRAKARLYRFHLRRPLDPHLAVYSAYWNRGVLCNPAAIHQRAKELAPHIRGVWVVRAAERDRLPEGVEHVVPGTRRYYRTIARATFFINNVNFPNELVKRPGTLHLQTHHGTPLKHMGLHQQDYPASANAMSFRRLLKRVDRWDFALSSNPHSSEVWEGAYPSSYRLLEYGYPRNDVLCTATAEDVAEARAELGLLPGTTAILYAPTCRDYRRGYVPRLDPERVSRALAPGAVLLMRSHYFYGARPEVRRLEEEGLVVDVSRHPSVERLCLAADALVTDYSSIMFDYANLDRPIVVFADDWEVYRATRGVYFDLLSGRPGDTPGPVARTEDELIGVFRDGRWNGADAARLRAAFRERFCPYDDGQAAARVVKRLFLDVEPPLPLPPSRRAGVRAALGRAVAMREGRTAGLPAGDRTAAGRAARESATVRRTADRPVGAQAPAGRTAPDRPPAARRAESERSAAPLPQPPRPPEPGPGAVPGPAERSPQQPS